MNKVVLFLFAVIITSVEAIAQLNVTISSANEVPPKNDIELGLALRSYLGRGALWDSIKNSSVPTAFRITIDAPGTVVDAEESFAYPTYMKGFDNEAFSKYLRLNRYIFTANFYHEWKFFTEDEEFKRLMLYSYTPNFNLGIRLPDLLNYVLSAKAPFTGYGYHVIQNINSIDDLLDRAPLTIGAAMAFPFKAESEKVFEESGGWDEYYNLIMIYYALDHIFGNYVMKNWYAEKDPRANFGNLEIAVDKEGYPLKIYGYKTYCQGLDSNQEIIISKMMAFFKNYNVRFKVQDNAPDGKLTLTFPGKLFEVYKKMSSEGYLFESFCNQLSATLYNREYLPANHETN